MSSLDFPAEKKPVPYKVKKSRASNDPNATIRVSITFKIGYGWRGEYNLNSYLFVCVVCLCCCCCMLRVSSACVVLFVLFICVVCLCSLFVLLMLLFLWCFFVMDTYLLTRSLLVNSKLFFFHPLFFFPINILQELNREISLVVISAVMIVI